MKQKADHHLEYLADRTERSKQLQSLLPSATGTASPSLSSVAGPGAAPAVVLGSRLRDDASGGGGGLGGDDEDAAGESDDAFGEGEPVVVAADDRDGNDFLDVASQGFREGGAETRGERGTPGGRGASVPLSSRLNGQVNGINRRSVRLYPADSSNPKKLTFDVAFTFTFAFCRKTPTYYHPRQRPRSRSYPLHHPIVILLIPHACRSVVFG